MPYDDYQYRFQSLARKAARNRRIREWVLPVLWVVYVIQVVIALS